MTTGARRTGRRRVRTVVVAGLALLLLAAACDAKPGDYTADGKADLVGYDDGGNWYVNGNATPIWSGPSRDSAIPAPADFNGDLKVDPTMVVGTTWYSSAFATPVVYDPDGMPAGPPANPAPGGQVVGVPPTLIPVPGDYDGSGHAVPAYYDQVDGTWWITGHDGGIQFGTPPTLHGGYGYSVPVPGDWDGDGKTDIAVYDPPTATFRYLSSKTGHEVDIQEGQPGDFPVPADYDKVGHLQAAVTDWNMTTWCVAGHPGAFATLTAPNSNDTIVPIQADYAGSGQAEPALFDMDRPSQAWVIGASTPVASSPTMAQAANVSTALLVNIARMTLYNKNSLSQPPTSCAAT